MKIFILTLTTCCLVLSCNNPSNNSKKEVNNESKNALISTIEEGLDKEQQIRKQFSENMDRDTFDFQLNEQMGMVDSINLMYALEYLEKYGYPSISKDGKKLCDGIFNILQHNHHSHMEKYVGELKSKAFKGEASKIHYAKMTDRILVENNKKQIYGTQATPRKNSQGYITNEYFIWPIEDNDIVDSLRKNLGFKSTVKEHALALDMEYNLKEPIPDLQK